MVVLLIITICSLSQDCPLPRIWCYPISTETRGHIGHQIVPRDLVSLADMLTFETTKGNMANLYIYPFPRIDCRFALHRRSSWEQTIPLPVFPSLHSVRVATLVKLLQSHGAKSKRRSRHVDESIGLVTKRLLRISPGSTNPYKHSPI